ncbi:hypothetical protein GCM10025734_75220 [Kitasatospora paranensis]
MIAKGREESRSTGDGDVTATAEELSGAGPRVAGPRVVLPGTLRGGGRPGSAAVTPDVVPCRGPVPRPLHRPKLLSIVICQVRKDSHV